MSEVLGELFRAKAEEQYKALRDFYTDKNLEFKTELNDKEIIAFSFMDYIENYINTRWLKDCDESEKVDFNSLITPIQKRKVSRNRLGRLEGIDVLKSSNPFAQEKITKQTGLGRFLV